MRFETYISDLLYRYECVIIPEFGAFLTQTVSAQVHESTNAFYPPKKVLSFNEQLKNNDGLLANYIASVEKIPFETAVQKIAKKTKSLKSFLAEGETLVFKNIGEITLSSEEKLLFEPSDKLNYLTDAFGLSQFTSPNITRETYKETVEAVENVVPLTLTPEKRKSRNYLKYAAVAVIALALGGAFTSNYYLGQIDAHNRLAEASAQEQLEGKIQEATFIIDNPLPAITLNVAKQSGRFHIVAGAFRIEANCNKKLAELKSLGYKARKIGTNKYGLHQVVYSSYESRQEAQRAMYQIRRTHNRDAWLLIQELD
ncbi:MAG: SPOR domain-containing protein [Bacteroidia bacterium]|nr:SPOR domain-containing protein [Bacteroidia bacterium]NND25674.1 HU-CCDC81 and SPOR domain-containing protein [Flavobacteriaceae bacterium]MBT8279260.1 SPOR domain-containing protein [Bacteroidia bacterium]NNK59796.1 HU-CCDC81 and SPOR domain-containing protein [Flavobacteriaceae bacterium]NNL32060.1 HU-CCDC81 and SPOR domain-containing protein [Flavobacteriaceae bacterium]